METFSFEISAVVGELLDPQDPEGIYPPVLASAHI